MIIFLMRCKKMVATASTLPHWDMTGVYPSLDSPQVDEAISGVVKSLERLKELFDRLDVRGKDAAPLDEGTVAAFEEALGQLNEVLTERVTVASYIAAHTATDSRDNLAQALWSKMQGNGVLLSKLYTRFTAWIGSLDVEELIARSQVAREHAYMLRKASEAARHLMSPEEEDLAAEMRLTGGMAWGKLHNNLTSQMVVP